MTTFNVFRTVLMRSYAAKYAVCIVLACAAALALAISLLVLAGPVAEPARAQVPPTPEATLAGAGDIASCRAYGVLKLDLYQGSYHWEFRPIANETFTDSGNDQCHPP